VCYIVFIPTIAKAPVVEFVRATRCRRPRFLLPLVSLRGALSAGCELFRSILLKLFTCHCCALLFSSVRMPCVVHELSPLGVKVLNYSVGSCV
jgi:hypothetical protein